MATIGPYLILQVILFLAPMGFLLFVVFGLRLPRDWTLSILGGAGFGFLGSCIAYFTFWPIIFPNRTIPVSTDGQNGLGEGLVMIALIIFSYSAAGLWMLLRFLLRQRSTPNP